MKKAWLGGQAFDNNRAPAKFPECEFAKQVDLIFQQKAQTAHPAFCPSFEVLQTENLKVFQYERLEFQYYQP